MVDHRSGNSHPLLLSDVEFIGTMVASISHANQFEHLVNPGRISIQRMIELYTVGPARVLGLRQGTLSSGADADITVIDDKLEWRYDVTHSLSKSSNTPFDGASL